MIRLLAPVQTLMLPPLASIHGWSAEAVRAHQRQAAAALGRNVIFRERMRDGGLGPRMAVIPPGAFLMGSPPNEVKRSNTEGPQHEVRLTRPFALGVYAVSFAEYERFCTATRQAKPDDAGWGRRDRPVIDVSWADAQAYCRWLSAQTGQRYRLPSEAEWEYAARAGTTRAFRFKGPISTDKANYDGNFNYDFGAEGEYRGKTVAVNDFAPNRWGLYQMQGNVWEWIQDDWHKSYEGAPADGSAWKSSGDCSMRVLRGGCWFYAPSWLRSAARFYSPSDARYYFVGFRLARDL